MTPRPSRSLSNALGRFSYHHLPLRYYAVGQELDQAGDGLSFLIAGAAKAVCDRLVLSRSLPPLSRGAMRQWLLEDLRLDPHLLAELNLATIRDCLATSFKRRQLSTLLAVIEGGNTGESNQALRECASTVIPAQALTTNGNSNDSSNAIRGPFPLVLRRVS